MAEWKLLDLGNSGSGLSQARGVAPTRGLGARFLNVDWKLGPRPDPKAVDAWLLNEGDRARGIALFLRQRRPLVFHFGEFAIGSVNLTRLTLIGDIHVDSGDDSPPIEALCSGLIDRLIPSLKSGESVYFEGLPVESATYRSICFAARDGGPIIALQLGEPFDHQFITMPDTYEEYLQGLGSRSRQSVQYSARKLEREMNGNVRVRKFESPADARMFLTDAAAISKRTYQTNLLGLGIHDDDKTLAQLTFAAERGWLRSYILYCNHAPVAFMLGHQYGNCFYYDDVGYDPEFAKWSVGSVLQLKVIEELYASSTRPAFFDFSTGYGSHKGRFGNHSRREVNLLVLPRNLKSVVVRAIYLGSASLSDSVVRLLTRMGAKDKIKKMIRRWKSG